MKSIFRSLSLAAMMALGMQTAQAQLPANSLAPDFTFTDINGASQNLYTILAQGKTVFIDVSAAWCSPCWNYHNTHALDSMWAKHGPTGGTGVHANTTNDAYVLFIEGELTNTSAQLTGTSTGTAHATFSQGNWTTGVDHPIIDLSSTTPGASTFMTDYAIGYFPTIYKICPNRILEEAGQKSEANLYAMVAPCPSPATQAVDATILNYTGADYICAGKVNVSATFQNHGTSALTGASANLLDGTTVLATQPITGSVASYAVGTVNFGNVTVPVSATTLTIAIVAAGDAVPADNILNANFGAINAAPYMNDFEADLNNDYIVDDVSNDGISWVRVTGAMLTNGNPGANGSTASMIMPFYSSGTSEIDYFYIPKTSLMSTTANAARITWNRAASQYVDASTPLTNDQLIFQASTDCGATWTNLWDKSGAALATHAGGTNKFYGSGNTTSGLLIAANEWANDTTDLTANLGQGEVLYRFKAVSDYGNNAYIDNISIELYTKTVGIENAANIAAFDVYPNPASTMTNIRFELKESSDVSVEVFNSNGQSVYKANHGKMPTGTQSVSLNTADFAAGIYMVNVSTNGQSISKMLTVK